MTAVDYDKLLTGLAESADGYRKKRPSVSRKVQLLGLIAELSETDVAEGCTSLIEGCSVPSSPPVSASVCGRST